MFGETNVLVRLRGELIKMILIEPRRNGEWVYDPGTTMAIQAYMRDKIFLDDEIVFPYMVTPSVQIGL